MLLVVVIFLGIKLSVESRPISGDSMLPGLHSTQSVLVNKLAYLFGNPQRGDVIIFHFPRDTNQIFIKRIIGLPGDTVTFTPTTVAVNGIILHEPYIAMANNCHVFQQAYIACPPTMTTKLTSTQFWVMGDNRFVSEDSRIWGPLDRSYLIGKASFLWLPLSSFQGIDGYHHVFAKAAMSTMNAPFLVASLLFCLPYRQRRSSACGHVTGSIARISSR